MDPLPRCCEAPRTYDHRIREAVCDANDPSLFDSFLTIPRSTARSWLRRGRPHVVSLDEGDFAVAELRFQIARLERRIRKYSNAARNLAVVIRLQRVELEASGLSLENRRVPSASAKTRILAAVARCRALLPLVIILDGTKVFLHAVVDNFSRRILAWRLCEKLTPTTTVTVLREAAAGIGITPTLVADSGVENVNGAVDALVDNGVVNRVLALVEVAYSNSIVEAYWRSLEHEWLYLNALDSVNELQRLVAFHVEQHNSVMPHSAFHGQTPDEVYFGTGAQVADELTAARTRARRDRLAANRAMSCWLCEPESRVESASVQLHRADS